MATTLVDGLGAAIGCRFLKSHNQLVFVEYSKGAISILNMVRPAAVVSQGTATLNGTWTFDCETGVLGDNPASPADIWWEQMTSVERQMVPIHNAKIVNLGPIDFAALSPAGLQNFAYGTTPIPGSNNATNQLTDGDVFAVLTKNGNYCKIKVLHYDYNMQIQWATYKLGTGYQTIGTGYTTPEDLAVLSDERTAYVTERTGNLLRVDLNNANRAAATIVSAGMNAPQQIWIDEQHKQAYVVEYATPGRLLRINLVNGVQTVLINNLSNAIGLLVTQDLGYAYISEQSGGGRVSRYSLVSGSRMEIASGLTNPFFLTWADTTETALLVAERDPANRITIADTVPHPGSVRQLVTGLPFRPSSVAASKPGQLLVCCDKEIDGVDILAGYTISGLFMGIGLVPWNLITAAGKADTTTQPTYPYQFPKGSPFGGTLSLQINHNLAWQGGVRYYRIWVDGALRLETWWDLQLNMANGKYEIPVEFSPIAVGGNPGYYRIHAPSDWYYNTNLGMILNSTSLPNGLRTLKVDFTNNAGVVLQSFTQMVLIDNNLCTAAVSMPLLDGKGADPVCGLLKYADTTHSVMITYTASHPNGFGTYSLSIIRGANSFYTIPGAAVSLSPFTYQDTVAHLLGSCTVAAFGVYLYVATTVINGYGRQSQYDASAAIAFALAP